MRKARNSGKQTDIKNNADVCIFLSQNVLEWRKIV